MTSSVRVNGTTWEGPADATVAALVDRWCVSAQGIAVARNGEVVPKSRWGRTVLSGGDRVEIVSAAAGG